MGLLYHAVKVPKLLSYTFFFNIFANAAYFLIGALTHLGLYKPPPPEQENADDFNGYVLIVDSSSPSLIPVPAHVVKTAIKSELPVVCRRCGGGEGEEVIGTCTVCLDPIELRHEVRELRSCGHVFHRECLDGWIDEGQITCPLCRSMLFPPRTILEWFHRTNREAILGREAAVLDYEIIN